MKPTIMILSSTHLDNPGLDAFNLKMDDVLTPKRQGEIEYLVEQLKPFRPTKIAVEQDPSRNAEINSNFQDYLNGTYKLQRSEVDQIGFRLAKQVGLSQVFCVDHFRRDDPMIHLDEVDVNLVDCHKFAKEHNQEQFLPNIEDYVDTDVKTHQGKDGETWIEPTKYELLIDMYRKLNQPEGRRADHQIYLQMSKIGISDQYIGANWVGHLWYARNLKIYVNLTRITEATDDRILLIIGAGHTYLIQQFLEESGDYNVECPLKYLDTEDTN
ncbi:MAG: DUF5694 domain-containing protein [Candidatus Poribacteria bacterium]|nr:DUF5694 domain-containing protein [Candidatus Poribacteria bacterium]